MISQENAKSLEEKPSSLIENADSQEFSQGIYYIKGNFRSFYREGKKIGEVFEDFEEKTKEFSIFPLKGCVGLVKKVQRIKDSEIFAVKIVKIQDEESVFAVF